MPTLPRSAERYRREQRGIARQTVQSARHIWRRVDPGDPERSWLLLGDRMVSAVSAGQLAAAESAAAYVPSVLDETGQAAPLAAVRPIAFVGVAGDGRSLAGLLRQAPAAAQARLLAGATPTQALAAGRHFLDSAISTAISDTGRAVEATAIAASKTGGWIRMLEGRSCSRCVVLAGQFYRWNRGFERHPGCDCRHIPASESLAGDLKVDPKAFFDSLPLEEQNRRFTVAGAEAIRMGADVGQVVNARRGMSTAQTASGRRRLVRTEVFGQQVYATTSGARRGRPRLMPESIVELAKDRADAIRLLRVHGYLL